MNATRLVATAGTVLALAACGSSSVSTAAPASRAASSAARASAPASVDAGTAGQVCAGLNAMMSEGDSGADAISTVANAYYLIQAQVVAAIDERCPQLKRIVPAALGSNSSLPGGATACGQPAGTYTSAMARR
jgi:hypothetical protein